MTYFCGLKNQLSSALKCLTSVFEMGTGVTTLPLSPSSLSKLNSTYISNKNKVKTLDLLVSVSSTCHHAYTPDLSTSSSIRGLTSFEWEISS